MNVEGDFRYVDPGAFDECMNFLEYLDDYENDWDGAFVGWLGASQRWKEDRKKSKDYWDAWNVVKVLEVFGFYVYVLNFDLSSFLTLARRLFYVSNKNKFWSLYSFQKKIWSLYCCMSNLPVSFAEDAATFVKDACFEIEKIKK